MSATSQASAPGLRVSSRGRRSPKDRHNLLWGLFFTSPAIIGLLWFTAYPVVVSLYYSFTSYSIFGDGRWVGLSNYRSLLDDPNFWKSLWNTVYYLSFAIPLGIVVALALALLLNLNVRGVSIYRTFFFLPSIVPGIAAAIVFAYVLNPQFGILNNLLRMVGINGPGWLASPRWAMPALILLGLWGSGNLMLILLAGLQDVPQDLYDAATVDGAGQWARFRHVTIPFLSPHLFFALITGLIAGFQYFAQPYAVSGGTGNPAGATLVYGLYIWQNVFRFFRMGYAAAMAWVMLVIIIIATTLAFRALSKRVYYGGA
jgi:multiple sugar transport system permease protein